MNLVVLSGEVVGESRTKVTANGRKVAKVSMNVGGTRRDNILVVVAFDGTADRLTRFAKVGNRILVHGHLVHSVLTRGDEVYEVVLSNVEDVSGIDEVIPDLV